MKKRVSFIHCLRPKPLGNGVGEPVALDIGEIGVLAAVWDGDAWRLDSLFSNHPMRAKTED